MAMHGTVPPFVPGEEDWNSYAERLTHYFIANGVNDATKKRSILLSNCGAATYQLVRSLLTAEQVNATSFEDIVSLVKNYYQPKPSKIVQRFKFNTRNQSESESIATYLAALRTLAEHCEYGDSLKEMLRDRLVCGVRHEGIQKRLLAEKDLTYDKALQLAQAIESAERDTRDIKRSATSSMAGKQVHYSQSHTPSDKRTTHPETQRPPRNERSKGITRAISCYRCGGDHLAPVCKFKDSQCNYCKKKGHLSRVCRLKARTKEREGQSKDNFHITDETESPDMEYEGTYSTFTIRQEPQDPIVVQIEINDFPVEMELDTGAASSLITYQTYQSIQKESVISPIEQSKASLKTYTGHSIPVKGSTTIKARYENQVAELSILVVEGEGPNLLGRNWMSQFGFTVEKVHNLAYSSLLKETLQEYSAVFTDELGCMEGVEVKLQVNMQAKPAFLKPRKVPYALKQKVEDELENLQKQGIISPVQQSDWAAPIVPVLKSNGSLRICGDYKTTVNQSLLTETYPLPRVEDLFANLSGGKAFTKLDLAQAYFQLPLAEDSKKFVTINTHKGLFAYNRLPFGVSSAPAIFQRSMETLLAGLPQVANFIDDILVTGSTTEEHLANLGKVLAKLQSAGLRLNRDKCEFLQPKIKYLGHVIDANGLHPSEDKIAAIKKAPQPKSVTELRSFLGLINYYGKFLPNLSTKLNPLYSLLAKQVRWSWGPKQEAAFQAAKEALQADTLLVHYDGSKPLVLACDASQYGIGAVLSHVMDDGKERPIAFASRTLNVAEKKYAQLEKEGLAIVFGVTKFHNYLYGRPFIIESDHKPLSFLFCESRGIPEQASSRIQRWALILSAYQYSIRYKAGKDLSNADALSRLPLPETVPDDLCTPGDLVHLVNHLSTTTASSANVKAWTDKDELLSKIKRFLLLGWPSNSLGDEFKAYTTRKDELSLLDGCILWGSRVIIPPQGRRRVLAELHDTHPGASKMKSLVRSYVWWPNMNAEIDQLMRSCSVCQETRPSPPTAPLHPWEWPSKPWSRLHLDFAGPYMGNMFLVIVDAHSKWMDAYIMSSITSTRTINKLSELFSIHGLPQKVVTDNGTSFTSSEFQEFMASNGIKHVTSAPYHPSSNGLAERAVQSFKLGLKKTPGKNIQVCLSKYLFKYRITPHSTTGVPPAELLMGRRLRSKLDLLYPELSDRVEREQRRQKQFHDSGKPARVFTVGDHVYAKNFSNTGPKWLPGAVIEVTGPLSYQIQLQDETIVRRHVDSVRNRVHSSSVSTDDAGSPSHTSDPTVFPDTPPPAPPILDPPRHEDSLPPPREPSTPPPPPPVQLRRSSRARHPPAYFS